MSLSPLVGGNLARPQDHWPNLFSHSFWAKYPYFLPCLVVAVYCAISLIIVALFLKEVRHHFFKEVRCRTTWFTDSDSSTPAVCKD